MIEIPGGIIGLMLLLCSIGALAGALAGLAGRLAMRGKEKRKNDE